MLRDRFKKLLAIQKPSDNMKPSVEFGRQHTEFLQALNQKADLFMFGALLLYIVNNGMTWKDSAELNPDKIDKIINFKQDFFEPKIYDRIKIIIRRCWLAAVVGIGDIGYLNFFEAGRNLEQEFGYFIKRIESVHTQPQRQDANPSKELPITVFRNHMRAFYNDFYYGNIEASLKSFRQAKKIRSQLGKGNDEALDSFNFNELMLNWIQGKISASEVIRDSPQWLSMQLLAHTNSYKRLHQAIKLLPTVHDSKFITNFDSIFNHLVEHYVYKDYNQKHTWITSGDKASISHVLVSVESGLVVVGSYKTGVQVYTLEREFKSSYIVEGLSSLAGGNDLGTIIIGANFGTVHTFEIGKTTGKIDEKSFKELYTHQGKVKVVEISQNGLYAMSYGRHSSCRFLRSEVDCVRIGPV